MEKARKRNVSKRKSLRIHCRQSKDRNKAAKLKPKNTQPSYKSLFTNKPKLEEVEKTKKIYKKRVKKNFRLKNGSRAKSSRKQSQDHITPFHTSKPTNTNHLRPHTSQNMHPTKPSRLRSKRNMGSKIQSHSSLKSSLSKLKRCSSQLEN